MFACAIGMFAPRLGRPLSNPLYPVQNGYSADDVRGVSGASSDGVAVIGGLVAATDAWEE